ncbi:MAG: hypothetical protein HYV36_07440 [Lentisphaerae bacterium]|nr:hypothetical protein [Lentisphaerota bacterium]
MDFSETILVGILISVLAWLITNVAMFFLKRDRLANAIVTDVTYHVLSVKEAKEYFEKLFQRTIKENQVIEYTAHYTRDEYELYKSMQKDLVRFFGKQKLLKIIKFYKAFWETEVLIEGFMLDLSKWKDEKRSLSKEDIEFLQKKQTRIMKLCEILSKKEICRLDDLPEDYRGRIEPSIIIL